MNNTNPVKVGGLFAKKITFLEKTPSHQPYEPVKQESPKEKKSRGRRKKTND